MALWSSYSHARPKDGVLVLHRTGNGRALVAFNFSDKEAPLALPTGTGWEKELDSSDVRWHGAGGHPPTTLAPASFVFYTAKEGATPP